MDEGFGRSFRLVRWLGLHKVGFYVIDITHLIFPLSLGDQFTSALIRDVEVA
jgi:hypothetical protein